MEKMSDDAMDAMKKEYSEELDKIVKPLCAALQARGYQFILYANHTVTGIHCRIFSGTKTMLLGLAEEIHIDRRLNCIEGRQLEAKAGFAAVDIP